MSDRLNVNVSNDVRMDLPMEIFPIAGEMFVYLNSCPQNYVNFYKYLLERPPSDIIITIQNAIGTFHKERFRNVSDKIMKRLANILEFKYIKPNELKWSKDINSVPGNRFGLISNILKIVLHPRQFLRYFSILKNVNINPRS